MIDADEPASWRDLQDRVARILSEAGVVTAVEKVIQTARGDVSIDVWAHDPAATPSQTYLVECKLWRTRVPQTIVHAFRTVVGDSDANWGAIISAKGFQKGAQAAAQYSNVRLLSWTEFQRLFAERWFSNHFVQEIAKATDALVDYTEAVNSRILRKVGLLSEDARRDVRRLRGAHMALGSFCVLFRVHAAGALRIVLGADARTPMPDLPLRNSLGRHLEANGMALADAILDATSYRSLLESVIAETRAAVAQFDDVFGERA
jgi:restriction system protein